ncbi:MAG: NAD-dependent epimerase/dehydratase family protein [Saprospiraceae bacterium]|nr:NAD-dependent epimerase/dehydratase family protein [Saprospiraceae bacterium]|tara:strand:+ start:2219 stop:3187 length:969 start_codon:yes stop_codon:yes gene_type:complete
MKRILVCGSGGFIGGHLTKKLKEEGHWVRGIDLKNNDFNNDHSDEFVLGDLRNPKTCLEVSEGIHEVYQLAADMGGAGYLFSGKNDADVMHNSALVNINILNSARIKKINRIFYSSSACVYPEFNQEDPSNPICSEHTVYPSQPDSEYGWEKLFSERLYHSFSRNYDIEVRIARFHNIFGEMGTWTGGKEKAPAAICRKVAEADEDSSIEIWGDGNQTRSFLHIDECIEGVYRLMNSECQVPVNIGSDELISINDFARMVIQISGKTLKLKHIDGPLGVRGRNSDNRLIKSQLGWAPNLSLGIGVEKVYQWVNKQVQINKLS